MLPYKLASVSMADIGTFVVLCLFCKTPMFLSPSFMAFPIHYLSNGIAYSIMIKGNICFYFCVHLCYGTYYTRFDVSTFMRMNIMNTDLFFVLFRLMLYVHGKQLRSCRDGQLS